MCQVVEVSIAFSDEACQKFGYSYKEQITDPNGQKGIILGVAPAQCRKKLDCSISDCPAKSGEKVIWWEEVETGTFNFSRGKKKKA